LKVFCLYIYMKQAKPRFSEGLIPFFLSRLTLDLTPKTFNAMLAVKGQRPLISHFLQFVRLMVGKITPNWVRLVVLLLRKMHFLFNTQGVQGYVKYLKASSVLVQQVSAGYIIHDLATIGPRVSRSKSGLPRIIPSIYRKRMMNGDVMLIKIILTLFAVFRVAVYNANPKLSTITTSRTTSLDLENDIKRYIPKALRALVGGARHPLKITPIFMGMSSSPNSKRSQGEYSTHPLAVIRSIIEICKDPVIFPAMNRMMTRFPTSPLLRLWNLGISYVSNMVGYGLRRNQILNPYLGITPLGKIGLKQEAAGKVRVFAMVDCWTQWLLKPLHSWIFSVLKKIPMDGTFDQLRPLKVYSGSKPVFSFDLSAATDRLPISFQKRILSHLFGSTYAHDWATLLVGRPYAVKYKDVFSGEKFQDNLFYQVGQPMGALSSWGMLALTHHVIVQIAAIRAGLFPFKGYALLGDDFVIWNRHVAYHYLIIMKALGLEVNTSKSILSPKGKGLEFAKRTFLFDDAGTHDVSPVSLLEYSAALETSSGFISFIKKYNPNLGSIRSLLGLGYKSNNSKRWRLFQLALHVPMTADQFKSELMHTLKLSISRETARSFKLEAIIKAFSDLANKLLQLTTKDHKALLELSNKLHLNAKLLYGGSSLLNKQLFSFHARETWQPVVMTMEPRFDRYHLMSDEISRAYNDFDSTVRGSVLASHIKKYDAIISDLKVMVAELKALPDLQYMDDPEVDEEYIDSIIDTNINTVVYWAPIFYNHEETLDSLQAQQILSPKPQESSSPKVKELSRLTRLWNRWNKALIERDNNSVLQSSLFPLQILNFLRTSFRLSRTAQRSTLLRIAFTRVNPLRFIPNFIRTNSLFTQMVSLLWFCGVMVADITMMIGFWGMAGVGFIILYTAMGYFSQHDSTLHSSFVLAMSLFQDWKDFTMDYFNLNGDDNPITKGFSYWEFITTPLMILVGYFVLSCINHSAEIIHATLPVLTDATLNGGFGLTASIFGIVTGMWYAMVIVPFQITWDAMMQMDTTHFFFAGVVGEILSWPVNLFNLSYDTLALITIGTGQLMSYTIITLALLPVRLSIMMLSLLTPFPIGTGMIFDNFDPVRFSSGTLAFAFFWYLIRVLFGF
jgi:hypothetical protein